MGMISLLFPLRTIIPVRENSEVVMIYPTVWLICALFASYHEKYAENVYFDDSVNQIQTNRINTKHIYIYI